MLSKTLPEIELTWSEVSAAKSYEVRIRPKPPPLDQKAKERKLSAVRKKTKKEEKRYLVKKNKLIISTPKEGEYMWEVRASHYTEKRKIQQTLSEATRSTFRIKTADVFTEAVSGSGYFAFSGLIASYQYTIDNPEVNQKAGMDSVSTTARLIGEYILSSNWGLDFGVDTTFFTISDQVFNRSGIEAGAKYRLAFGSERPWVVQPRLGLGMRNYLQFAPSGTTVQASHSPWTLGGYTGFDLRKQLSEKISVGARFTYYLPVTTLGLESGGSLTSSSNYSIGAQGVYWLGGSWGLLPVCSTRNGLLDSTCPRQETTVFRSTERTSSAA